MYRTALFSEKKFPVGRLYEDAFTIPDILLGTSKVAATTKRLYYYIRRAESITRAPYNEKSMDKIYAFGHVYETVKKNCPQYEEAALYRLYQAYFSVLDKMLYVKDYKMLDDYKTVTGFIKEHAFDIRKNEYLGKTRKLSALALKFGIPFYRIFWHRCERLKKKPVSC